jgi:CRP/FNR family cyclic AMP-dependent transcriptional regulator
MRQGDHGGHVLVLTAGRVKVSRAERDGSVMLLAVRGPGQVLGEVSVLDESPRSATVTALDQCRTYLVSATRFRSMIGTFGLQDLILRHMVTMIREGEVIRAELAELPAAQRVIRALVRLGTAAAADGQPNGVDLGLSQDDLAAAVGLSRSAVAAELAGLRSLGLVVTGRQRLRIRDLARLRMLSGMDGGGRGAAGPDPPRAGPGGP